MRLKRKNKKKREEGLTVENSRSHTGTFRWGRPHLYMELANAARAALKVQNRP